MSELVFEKAADERKDAPRGQTRAQRAAVRPASTAQKSQRRARAPKPRGLKIAAWLQTFAELMWLPQAACLAHGIGLIARGEGVPAVLPLAAAILALGFLKAIAERAGSRLAYRTARAVLSKKRDSALAALSRRSPLDTSRLASGEAASVIAEQAEHIVPYLARFQTARFKATVVPLAILAVIFPFSWIAGLVLLIAAPLIPVFMALIGWSAQSASEKHLADMGTLNAFLLDRLRGLSTIRAFDAVDLVSRRLTLRAENLRRRTMSVLRIAFMTSAVLELFSALGVAMAAAYIGFHLLGQIGFGAWGGTLTLSEGLFILLLAPAFFDPLRMLSSVWHDRAAGEAALAALDKLAEDGLSMVGAEKEDIAATRASDRVHPVNVEFRDLGFVHQGSRDPFSRASTSMLPPANTSPCSARRAAASRRFWRCWQALRSFVTGRILIDDVTLDDANAAQLRTRMAWIGQNPHLFAGSIAGNIRLHRDDISLDAVASALKLASLEHVAEAHGNAMIGGERRGTFRRRGLAADAGARCRQPFGGPDHRR